MLLAMGRDAAKGVLLYEPDRDALIADLDLVSLAPGYVSEELFMADIALKLGGELRSNPAWAFLGKPITVHNQGGCPMATKPEDGVTDPDGKVHGCPGLYVLDGSILCRSVGVNPSATIAAIAEYNVLKFIRRARSSAWPEGDESAGAREYAEHVAGAARWIEDAKRQKWAIRPPPFSPPLVFKSEPVGVEFQEKMEGYFAETSVDPAMDDEQYRRLETRGRPDSNIKIALTVGCTDLTRFIEDQNHEMDAEGEVTLRLPGSDKPVHPVKGRVHLFVARYKPYGLRHDDVIRLNAQRRLADEYTTIRGPRPAATGVGAASASMSRFMRYTLRFTDHHPWTLVGYKRIHDQAGLGAWRDTSTLFFKLVESTREGSAPAAGGVAHVDLFQFLYEQLPSLKATGTADPARSTWATGRFAAFFFGSLERITVPKVGSVADALFGAHANSVHPNPREPGT